MKFIQIQTVDNMTIRLLNTLIEHVLIWKCDISFCVVEFNTLLVCRFDNLESRQVSEEKSLEHFMVTLVL